MRTPAARVRERYDETVRAIERRADLDRAFRELTDLADVLRDLAQDAAIRRARTARRIARREKLSVAGLASRLAMSKARAAQLLYTARASDRDIPVEPASTHDG